MRFCAHGRDLRSSALRSAVSGRRNLTASSSTSLSNRVTVGFKLRTDLSKNRIPPVRLAEGWQATTHVDGVPEHLLDEVGAIQGLVDEEAPSGEIEWQAHAVTPDEYRSGLQAVLDEGCHLVEAIALAPDGRVAGWKGLKTAPNDRRSAQVLGTMVLEEFRGHGVGMALKSAVATSALGVGVTTLSTECNADTRWMLDINVRQGFERIGVTAAFLPAAS